MPLPENFDQNEWFVLISLLISYAVVFFLPKRFPVSIAVIIMLFALNVARLFDHLLSTPHLELYTMMDTGKYELFDLLLYLLYPPFAYLFVYLFDRLRVRGYWIVFYLVVSSGFGTFFEWINVKFHVFQYFGWKLPYSFTVYLVTQTLTLLLFEFLRKHTLDFLKQ